MRPSNVRSSYTDNLVRKRRTIFVFKIVASFILFLIIFVGIVYSLFFLKFLEVKSITISGLSTLSGEDIKAVLDNRLDQKYLNIISRRNNIYLLNIRKIKKELLTRYPILDSVFIKRNLPHALVLDFTERIPIGTWCFKDKCYFFDSEKNIWPSPGKSSGFLLLSIEDNREVGTQIDEEYFEVIRKIYENLNKLPVQLKDVEIPADSFRDFKIKTSKDYYLMFSLDSDIEKQVDLLKIFLEEKQKQAGFNAQYLDLRIDGRVYFK